MTEQSTISIGGRLVGYGCASWIVAEVGINHEGSVATCARMIEAAAAAGADAVKLQTIDPDANYVRGTESYRVFSNAQLSRDETARMFDFARGLGIEIFTTAGDPATLAWVNDLAPCAHKISSGLMTHLPLIRIAAAMGRPLLMSTGLTDADEIDQSLTAARNAGAHDIALFQCTSSYPTPPEGLHLGAIRWMSSRFEVPVGFSDHSVGVEAAPLAVAAGAALLEKHFSLDPARPGYDHGISLDPVDFGRMVRAVRAAEVMIGKNEKDLSALPPSTRDKNLRCLVAARDIAAGEVLDEGNVAIKRPLPGRRGLPPSALDRVLGRRAAIALGADAPIRSEDVEGLR